MAAEAFNSLGGYSIGIPPETVITENGAATFTSLKVSGFSNLGPVSNVYITGGENGYFLQTDGTGNLTWSPASGNGGNGNPGGANSQVQFNDAGVFGGDAGFTYDKVNNVLSLTGNIVSYELQTVGNVSSNNDITANGNVYANYYIGNGSLLTGIVSDIANFSAYAGNVTRPNQPNITSLGTLTNLSVSGTIVSGNANLGYAASANYFVGNGALLTGIAKATSADAVANGTSNVNIPVINSNVNISVGGNPNVLIVTPSGVVSRNLNITGNSIFTNVSISQKFNANQASNVNLGTVSNLHIDGGLNGYFLQTDGFGNLSWAAAGGGGGNGTPGGANTQVQFNNAGAFGGDAGFTYNKNTNTLNVENLNIANTSNLGSIDNVIISGGTAGYVITTDGSGNLSWQSVSGSAIANGQSNLSIDTTNGNITAGVNGTPNVVVITSNGLSVNGNISANNFVGNITGNATTAETVTTNSQPNITSVGTLTSLDVNGAITATSFTANTGVFTGNGNGLSSIVGANVTGQVGNSLVAGTVYTNAQPNITSVGTLTSLTVSGNANLGNVYTGNFVANGTGSFGGNLNMNTYWINNVGYPNLSTDAATKAYVDTMISSGISYHQPVNVATTTTLAIATGGTTAYVQPNGAGNGVGAYISTTGTYLNIDGANVQTVGTRILVKNEANASWNGVYTYANTTAIVRSLDADIYGPDSTEELSINDFFFTLGGIVNEGTSFIVSAPVGNIIFGTSNITFSIFTTSQVYDAGTGLTLNGTTFSISNTSVTSGSYGNGDTVPTFTVNDQGQLTSASNTAITANAANLTGTTLNSSIVTSSLTSVGTLGNLTVSGNLTSGNANLGNLLTANYVNISNQINGNIANFSGNLTATNADLGNLVTANYVNVSSQLNGNIANFSGNLTAMNADLGNLVTANYFHGVFDNTSSSQPNITNVGALTGLTVSNATGVVNFANTSNVTLGNVSNLHIAGGNLGYVLGTDGTGNLSWIDNGVASVVGNSVPLGLPSDGNLTANVAYNGWTISTSVTDGLDDLNQVSLNIAGNTFVGNIYITSNATSGPSPLTVAFTGNYIGNPTNYLWNFGDGTTSTVRNPTKTYSNTSGGQFNVTFTAYNVNGTYGGNAANGAKGSTATSTNNNYITLYTPLPIPSFTTSNTSLNTGGTVTITNTSLYATSYTINYGDGNSAVNPGNSWTTNSHTYNTAANVDTIYGINLTGTNQTAGVSPPYSVTSANTNVKVYAPQSPAFSANVTTIINNGNTSGGVVSFRNDTPGTPGPTSTFGSQQLYSFQWGDGTANSNINIQSGLAGNPGAANINHTFSLTSAQQNAGTTVNFVTNLSLYTGYSSSPFVSGNITISVEPEIRANFVGTANTQTDATGYTSNAQVGYLYTDYFGRDRSLFNFRNDTSPNVSFTGNLFNWSWGDTTSNSVTSFGNISHSYLNGYGSPTVGSKTVSLQANGTPGTNTQSNTQTKTNYITILPNPTAPANLSSFTNVTISTASQGTSPLLAANANDNTGGNIVSAGTAVTRVANTTPITTGSQVVNANTATIGTLTAYVNNTSAGSATFTTSGNSVGTYSSLIISADRDLHVANAAVPTGFYKVFSASISNSLASLGNGYNDFQLRHSVSGNTNTVAIVKDNLNSAPTLVTSNVAMTIATSGTYRYISGIPYFSATGSPAITVANLELQNFTGQTFRSADPFTLASGTVYEGVGPAIATQIKSVSQIDNSANSMLSGSNVKANIGIGNNYTLGNLNVLLDGNVNGVVTLAANIFNVVDTSSTIQLPTKIQMYAGANSGINEQAITANVASNTQPAIRVVMSNVGNTPAFSRFINYYASNAWTGAQTIAGTPEAVVRYGVIKNFTTDLSTGYLPAGPNLNAGRSGLQYFTFAFVRTSLSNFDIILTTGASGLSGLWIAAPGTTIDSSGFSSPTPGWPGPTSTINGWLTGFEQYNGSGVPGNSATGGNPAGTNGCALTGADVIPLNTQISNSRFTMTLGSQNQANSFGKNILIRIALAAGQTITDLQIGVAT